MGFPSSYFFFFNLRGFLEDFGVGVGDEIDWGVEGEREGERKAVFFTRGISVSRLVCDLSPG